MKLRVLVSTILLVKQESSPAWQSLQYSPDSVQSSTLSEATRLFLVAVTLNHRPSAMYLLTEIWVIAVRAPPNEKVALPPTSWTARMSDLPPEEGKVMKLGESEC